MSARTDQTRTTIARELLAAMLQGTASAASPPNARMVAQVAVQLTDALISELDATEKRV